jgi:hypothetical protein
MGSAFPLFTAQMYERLGINWASTLIAFLALACTRMPMWVFLSYVLPRPLIVSSLFYIYGERIRVKTKFGREANEIGMKMRRSATMEEKLQLYRQNTARAHPGGPGGVGEG